MKGGEPTTSNSDSGKKAKLTKKKKKRLKKKKPMGAGWASQNQNWGLNSCCHSKIREIFLFLPPPCSNPLVLGMMKCLVI